MEGDVGPEGVFVDKFAGVGSELHCHFRGEDGTPLQPLLYILPFGRCLGTTANLGPQAKSDLCASLRGRIRQVDNPFLVGVTGVAIVVTHVVVVVIVIPVVVVVIPVDSAVVVIDVFNACVLTVVV